MFRPAVVIAIACAFAGAASAAELRLCETVIRTTPLSDERGVQSALVQAVAVVNTDSAPETLTEVSFQLSDKQQPRDQRWLAATDIAHAAKLSPQVAMLAQIFPMQFCNGRLLAGARLATSDTLAPGEALVFLYQPFVWKGARDTITIAATTSSGSRSITLPLVAGVSKTALLFPVAGRSFVPVAASFHTPHRWAGIEEFAQDIVMLSSAGSTHDGDGSRLSDYAIFGQPVRAAAAGKVVAATRTTADNVAILKRQGETDEAYLARLQEAQMTLLLQGMGSVLGNHVIIDHGNGEFSIYAHLKQGSVTVVPGTMVAAGAPIGKVGSSGNSTEPHLHFQVCDGPEIANCRAIPPNITGYRLPFELGPRTIQSGDMVETTR